MNLLRLARLTAAVFTAASGLFLANVAQATDVVATKALDLGAGGQVGKYTSQAIVAGKPAVSYYDVTNGDLKFVRASNAAGTAWDAPVTIDSTGDVGQYASLVVVDGNPAVAYYDATNGDLKYVRATDATGSAWDSPVTLDSTGDVGQYISLAMVNGNPAVSYYDVTNEDLKFVRANDTSGSSWGAGAAVDSTGNVGGFSSLVVVNGYPAIAYLDATGGFYVLKYVRATDASGASWDAPVPVDGGGDAGFFVSLALVNGNPAISYQDVVAGDLKYVRSIDVNGTGTGWSSATIVTVDSAGSVGAYTSLATINSRPAISYYDTTGGNLKYAWASDANGAGWGTPAFVDTLGIVGLYTSLINLNGSAAISYQDVSNGNLNWATITTLPTVTSPTIANVASFSATLGGNVTADGGPTITSRGIVYAVTATNNNPQFLGTGVSSVTTSGTTGVFTVSVTGLAASTAYSYAAFATNSGGTSYTTIGTFTTLIAPPIITSTLTASGVVGTPFSTYSITATNSPTSFGATGLPGGLTVNTATGEITGTPDSAAGSPFGVTIAATNAGGTDTATLVITIGKAAQGGLSVSSSAGGTFGSGYTAKAAGGSGTGALSWSLGTGSTAPGAAIDATSGAVTSSGAGTVVVKVTKAADANYFSTTSADFTITLAKATQSTLAVTSSASGTFGSAYAATASGGSGTGGLSWALGTGSTAPGAAIDASSGAVTSSGAGTVVVQATKAGDANYFSASSADFTIALAKAAQAAVTVTSSASGTYGSAYTATAGGGTGTGGLSWALGTGSTAPGAAIDASTGAVTSTGAGTVVVRATKASDANYLLATSADFTITLAKAAQATVSITSPATGTFGVAYTATATGGNGTGAIVWALGTGSTASSAAIDPTTGAVTFASPGTVVFNATRAADANYNASVTTADFSVTVGKAAQVAVTVASPGSGTFGSSYNATAAGGSGTGAIAWNLGAGSTAPGAAINSSTGAVTSTGAGTVVINATKAGDANYLSATAADFTVTLAKSAQAVVSITSAATGTYGVAYTATASGGTGTGAIVWALGAGSTASGAAINATTGVVTFASTGTVVFQASRAGDANYNASAPTADFVITVGKASATVTLGSLTPTYDGTAHAATATTVPAALSVTYTYDGSATAPTSAGNYAVVGTINEPNYQGSATGTLTVAKAVPVITWAAPAAVNPGAILGATQLNATASTPGTFTYSPAAGTVLAGGFQTLTASFVPTDTANYTNATAQQTLTVITGPVITTQPLSGAVFAGGTFTFVAAVNGAPTPTYQWQRNGINIPGANSVTLTLSNIQVADAGSYALVATNVAGTVTSRFARLVVLVPQANATTYTATVYPTAVTVGGNVGLDYALTNIGTHNWGANHYLSIRDSNGTFVAFATLIGANSGENKTAHLSFLAPMTPGTYVYTVQGLEDGVEFFGTQTTFTLNVLAVESNSITYNTTNFPVTATPGSNLIFTYNVTNTGTSNWGLNHVLNLRDGNGATLATSPLNGVTAGQSKTVNLSFSAPATPGIYSYSVKAVETGGAAFNAQANLTLTVLAPQPNAIVYTPTRSTDNVTPGATVNLRYSLSNAGTGTWGASHYASLRDGQGNFLAFVPLSGVAPLGTKTVEFSFVAPTTPGVYPYYVQALEDGVEFFDNQDLVTLTVLATPIANAATYNATTFPITAARGASVNFTSNLTNRGTKTWGANHYLSLRDADNIFLGFQTLNGIAPGSSQTVSFTFTAPSSPGVYTYHVQGFESGIEFFNMSDNLVLIVP